MKVLSRSLVSKAMQSLDQSCLSSGCIGRPLKSSTGGSHWVTSNSGPPVSCVLVLVTKFPLCSWEHDTILYTKPKLRPTLNPYLETYPDETKARCCQCYLFPKWDSCDLCSAVSVLPSGSPVLSILILHGNGQPTCRDSSLFFKFSVMPFKVCSRWTHCELAAFLFQSYLGCFYLPSPEHRYWRGIPS